MKVVNSLEKYQYYLFAQLFAGTLSWSTRLYLSGNNTSEIVHLTKRRSITESKVTIKTCFTTSEHSIERESFKVNAHLSSSNENPVFPSRDF